MPLHYSTWDSQGFEIYIDESSNKAIWTELSSYFEGKIRLSSEERRGLSLPVRISTCEAVSNILYAQNLAHYVDHEILKANDENSVKLLVDKNLEITFDHEHGLQIRIEKCALDNRFLRSYILRTVRSYVDKMMIDSWFQLFHLWAVEINGITILIAWDKGAGKTTSVVMALERLGANYIANDRVWWRPEDEWLNITEREAETKVWIETIQNSDVLSKEQNPQKDPVSWKFFFNGLHRFFGTGRRAISGVWNRILLPMIQSNRHDIESCSTNSILADSIIQDCQWFNLYRAIFGEPGFRANPKIEGVLKMAVRWHWPSGILKWFEFLIR